jgi:hypothetical protein
MTEWHEDPDVLSWDVRQVPDLGRLAELLARHGVTLTEVDTGTDDVAVRITTEPVAVLEDGLCRRIWAAALRYGAAEIRKWVGTVANPETLAAMADEAADQIEGGELTPWADAPEPAQAECAPGCDYPVSGYHAKRGGRVLCTSPEPVTPPAQQPATAPTGPDAATDTGRGAQTVPGVLGRGLLDAEGDLWTEAADGRWLGSSAATDPWDRAVVARRFGPVREVLLVDPRAGDVLAAAQRWGKTRDAWTDDPDKPGAANAFLAADRALAAAVDALGDRAPAPAPGGNPYPHTCTGESNEDCTACAYQPHADDLAREHPEPDSGTGVVDYRPAVVVLTRELATAVDETRQATQQRNDARAALRVETEISNGLRQTVEAREAEADQLRQQLEAMTADRDGLAVQRDRALADLRDHVADADRIHRDGAADAVEDAANDAGRLHVATGERYFTAADLRELAAQLRRGDRTVKPEPDADEPVADHCLNCNRPMVRRGGRLVHRAGDPHRCMPPEPASGEEREHAE